jgi:hypothetical protein
VGKGECGREESIRRGNDRLLHDCAVVGRVLTRDRPSASERCRAALGAGPDALLRLALTGDHALNRELIVQPAPVNLPDLKLVGASPVRWIRRPEERAILQLRSEHATAVSLGTGRNRKRRVGSTLGVSRTRALRAAQNKQLVGERFGVSAEGVELACECGDDACTERVLLTGEELAFLASVPTYYAVCPQHVSADDHVLVGDPDRFVIVDWS